MFRPRDTVSGSLEPARELDGSLAPADRLGVVAAEHPHVGLEAVRDRELVARRQSFERLDRGAACFLGLVVSPERHVRGREPGEVVSHAQDVAELTTDRDRLVQRA